MSSHLRHLHVDHLIIGAGFAGLCAAIKLQEDGETDFVVIEQRLRRGRHLAGQHLPGRRLRRPQPALLLLLRAQPTGRAPTHRSRRSRPTSRRSPPRPGRSTASSSTRPLEDAVVGRRGPALDGATPDGTWSRSHPDRPAPAGCPSRELPDIEGIETFQGEVFHSARWNHRRRPDRQAGGGDRHRRLGDPDRAGAAEDPGAPVATSTSTSAPRRGSSRATTGSTATSRERRCAACPGSSGSTGPALYWGHEAYVPAFTLGPESSPPRPRGPRSTTSSSGIKDPELREKVMPHFTFGCKRVLISNDYYPALAADNVEVVTDPIAKVTGNAIVTAGGTEREIDVLVVATGFYTTELPITEHVTGRAGRTLADQWRETGMAAYKGTHGPGLPEPVHDRRPQHRAGPLQHDPHHRVAGRLHPRRPAPPAQAELAGQVEASQDATDRWNRSLQKRMKRTVWTTGGCQSWYLDAHGRNTTLWPRSTARLPAPAGVVRRRRLTCGTRSEVVAHEDARRQGGRDHRRRLRHRPGAGAQPGPPRLAARAVRRRRGRARRDGRAGHKGRRRPGAQRPARRRRPRRLRPLRARRRPGLRPGQRRSSTTPASRWPATSPTSSTTTSTGSSASTSGASCTAPRSSCRT